MYVCMCTIHGALHVGFAVGKKKKHKGIFLILSLLGFLETLPPLLLFFKCPEGLICFLK